MCLFQLNNFCYNNVMSENLIYKSDRTISSAYLDSSVRLGVAQAVLMIQDNLTECFNMMNCDGIMYKERYNAFWVFTKTKVHFFRHAAWRENITAATFPIDNCGMRSHINTVLAGADGEKIAVANQEACVLDFERHRPVKITDLDYPKEGFPEAVYNEPFQRFPSDFSEDEFVYEHTVRSQQIDLSHHLNNIEYIKLALNCFSEEVLLTREVSDLEMHYTGESKEGQVLRIFKKETDEGYFFRIFEVSSGEKPRSVFEMMLKFYD